MSGRVVAVSSNNAYSFSKPNRDRIVLVPGLGVQGDIHAGVRVRHRSRVAADPDQPNLRQVHLIQTELFAEVATKGYDVPEGGLGENISTAGLDLLALPCGTVLRFGPPVAAESLVAGPFSARGDGPGGEAGVTRDGGAARDVVAAARRATLDEATAPAVAVLAAVIDAELERDPADGRPAVVLTGLRNPCAQINNFRPGLLKEVLGRDRSGELVRRAGVMGVVLHGGEIRPGDPVTASVPALPHRQLGRV